MRVTSLGINKLILYLCTCKPSFGCDFYSVYINLFKIAETEDQCITLQLVIKILYYTKYNVLSRYYNIRVFLIQHIIVIFQQTLLHYRTHYSAFIIRLLLESVECN